MESSVCVIASARVVIFSPEPCRLRLLSHMETFRSSTHTLYNDKSFGYLIFPVKRRLGVHFQSSAEWRKSGCTLDRLLVYDNAVIRGKRACSYLTCTSCMLIGLCQDFTSQRCPVCCPVLPRKISVYKLKILFTGLSTGSDYCYLELCCQAAGYY